MNARRDLFFARSENAGTTAIGFLPSLMAVCAVSSLLLFHVCAGADVPGSASSASIVAQPSIPPSPISAPDVTPSLLRVFGALVLVVAVFMGGVWGWRNWRRLASKVGGRVPRLDVIEARSLGQRHILYVVGYDEKRMLLAVSPTAVSLISELPSEPAVKNQPPAAAEPFATALGKAAARLTGGGKPEGRP